MYDHVAEMGREGTKKVRRQESQNVRKLALDEGARDEKIT